MPLPDSGGSRFGLWLQHSDLWLCLYMVFSSSVSFVFLIFIYLYFGLCPKGCGILVPRPGIEPGPPTVEVQSFSPLSLLKRWVVTGVRG